MVEFNSHQEINNLGDKAKNLITYLEKIDGQISEKDNVDRDCKDLNAAFRQAISGEFINDFPFVEVKNFLTKAEVFAKAFSQFQMANEQEDFLKINREKNARKAERLDYWKLWSQRAIRALISAVILVSAYSSLVWLSERYGFVKIPIRDLVANSQ